MCPMLRGVLSERKNCLSTSLPLSLPHPIICVWFSRTDWDYGIQLVFTKCSLSLVNCLFGKCGCVVTISFFIWSFVLKHVTIYSNHPHCVQLCVECQLASYIHMVPLAHFPWSFFSFLFSHAFSFGTGNDVVLASFRNFPSVSHFLCYSEECLGILDIRQESLGSFFWCHTSLNSDNSAGANTLCVCVCTLPFYSQSKANTCLSSQHVKHRDNWAICRKAIYVRVS